jgi:Spy/CpxP family protein refolding chaperone
MSRTVAVLVVLLLACAPAARAQFPAHDPVAEHLFPPELVMRYAADIGLEDRQRTAMKEAIQKLQSRVLDLQFEVQGEAQKLVRLLQARPVDEAAVVAQADRVMGIERDVKKAHLALLVRIKNGLSEAQQEKLSVLRRKQAAGSPGK